MGNINRNDMLELTRRMTSARSNLIRIAGAYIDEEGYIDGTFNTSFLNLYELIAEKYPKGRPYAIYMYYGAYDVPIKGSDKAYQDESEEVDMLIVLEGLAMSFWLLLICVVGIAKDGPVGLVNFYEKDAQERVLELGLTTKEKIKKAATISGIALIVPLITAVPAVVYLLNGVTGFWNCFIQLLCIYMIMNLFDRFFIDEWWVNHTKAWIIPGTEDLMPYVNGKARIRKWVASLIMFPVLAAIIAGVIQAFT